MNRPFRTPRRSAARDWSDPANAATTAVRARTPLDFAQELPRFADLKAHLRARPHCWGGGSGALRGFPDILFAAMPSPIPPDPAGLWVSLAVGSIEVSFRLSAGLASAILQAPVDLLTPEVVGAELETNYGNVFDILEAANGQTARVVRVGPDAPQISKGASYDLSFVITPKGGAPVAAYCKTCIEGLLFFAEQLVLPWPGPLNLRYVPLVPCSMALHPFEMSLSDFRSLRPGDALLCDRETVRDIWLRMGQRHGLCLRATGSGQATAGALQSLPELDSPASMPRQRTSSSAMFLDGDFAMQDNQDPSFHSFDPEGPEPLQETAQSAVEETVDLGRVEQHLGDVMLRVQAVLTEFTASFADLERLYPGAVVEMPQKPIGKVDLIVSNVKIGEGQLIRIGEDTALEILKLNKE